MESPETRDERRREPHKCACGTRFEVGYHGDPMEDPVAVEVRCPRCGKEHSLSVPRAARHDLIVEPLPGPEPETGGGD